MTTHVGVTIYSVMVNGNEIWWGPSLFRAHIEARESIKRLRISHNPKQNVVIISGTGKYKNNPYMEKIS